VTIVTKCILLDAFWDLKLLAKNLYKRKSAEEHEFSRVHTIQDGSFVSILGNDFDGNLGGLAIWNYSKSKLLGTIICAKHFELQCDIFML